MPMLLTEAEGHTEHGFIRQSCSDPARAERDTRHGALLSDQRLEDMSKNELMELARKNRIAGRSTMRKGELIEAL
jgi:hypothetical protein